MTEALRVAACVLSSLAVVLLIVNTLGPRGARLSRQSRVKSAVGIPVLAAVDYGAFYALDHQFPLNAALWLLGPALALFDLVYLAYFIHNRRTNG